MIQILYVYLSCGSQDSRLNVHCHNKMRMETGNVLKRKNNPTQEQKTSKETVWTSTSREKSEHKGGLDLVH